MQNSKKYGSSDISRALQEKAISFEVLLICSKDNCAMYEQQVVDHCGMGNLLNNRRAKV